MRKIKDCLNHKIANICKKSINVEEVGHKIKNFLPEHIAPHCTIGGFDKGCLTIYTTDPVWAHELRFLLPSLREDLRKKAGIYGLGSIKIQIKPIEEKFRINSRRQKAISDIGEKAIKEIKDTVD